MPIITYITLSSYLYISEVSINDGHGLKLEFEVYMRTHLPCLLHGQVNFPEAEPFRLTVLLIRLFVTRLPLVVCRAVFSF
jgi:hypothetical protein